MKIIEVKENKKQYLDLLLLADEQEDMVDRYLDNGKMYVLDDKPNLSIEEASIYSNIGTGKLYEMTEKQDCPFVLWIGSRRMIKRKIFEEYIANQYSI